MKNISPVLISFQRTQGMMDYPRLHYICFDTSFYLYMTSKFYSLALIHISWVWQGLDVGCYFKQHEFFTPVMSLPALCPPPYHWSYQWLVIPWNSMYIVLICPCVHYEFLVVFSWQLLPLYTSLSLSFYIYAIHLLMMLKHSKTSSQKTCSATPPRNLFIHTKTKICFSPDSLLSHYCSTVGRAAAQSNQVKMLFE